MNPDITPSLRHIALNVLAFSPMQEMIRRDDLSVIFIRSEWKLRKFQGRDLLWSRRMFRVKIFYVFWNS